MPKPQYGTEHKRSRAIAISTLVEGTPCRYCLRPMYRYQSLDLDHIVPVVMGGNGGPTVLTHSYCNRSMGSRIRARRNKYRVRNNTRVIVQSRVKTRAINAPRKRLPVW